MYHTSILGDVSNPRKSLITTFLNDLQVSNLCEWSDYVVRGCIIDQKYLISQFTVCHAFGNVIALSPCIRVTVVAVCVCVHACVHMCVCVCLCT